jgi:hypothetical protein
MSMGLHNQTSITPLSPPPLVKPTTPQLSTPANNYSIANNATPIKVGYGYVFTKKWGSNGTNNGQFSYPYGITTDSSGNVYVADSDNFRVQEFSQSSNG